ncbi:MAG: transcription elongation factor GreA, partial [Dehalococcoidia bacterium]|nr:transcription elongation factor GreA [Dehalococcoidia bacterium]
MLRLAMADKDFRENAPLDAAREHQGMVEARIRELEAIFRRAQVADSNGGDSSRAGVGSTLVITDMDTNEAMKYTLVHPNEVNLAVGKISVVSPTGKSLLDRSVLDVVEVVAPSGVLKYRIESIG